jgi:hypothetical protein
MSTVRLNVNVEPDIAQRFESILHLNGIEFSKSGEYYIIPNNEYIIRTFWDCYDTMNKTGTKYL